MFTAPGYPGHGPDSVHDITLIKLAHPLSITRHLQTVAIPNAPRRAGVVGTLASGSHNTPLPPDKLAIFRAPIPDQDYPLLWTIENGRATVRAIASLVSTHEACDTPFGDTVFDDVYADRDWIVTTMRANGADFSENTRIRWSGYAASGEIGIDCPSTSQTAGSIGPLNVPGVEEAVLCSQGHLEIVRVKQLSTHGHSVPSITGLTMRTTVGGTVTENRLFPVGNSGTGAVLHADSRPPGAVWDFVCQIGDGFSVPSDGTLSH